MKIYLLLFFISFNGLSGQNKKDSLYSFFEKNSNMRSANLYKADSSKYRSYRFDLKWEKEFSEYKSLVTSNDIEDLKNSNNSSLHLIGVLIDFNRNNSKENILKNMNGLLNNNKYEFIEIFDDKKRISGHHFEDAVMNFIVKENKFYKSSFVFEKYEKRDLSKDISHKKVVPFIKLSREFYRSNH